MISLPLVFGNTLHTAEVLLTVTLEMLGPGGVNAVVTTKVLRLSARHTLRLLGATSVKVRLTAVWIATCVESVLTSWQPPLELAMAVTFMWKPVAGHGAVRSLRQATKTVLPDDTASATLGGP